MTLLKFEIVVIGLRTKSNLFDNDLGSLSFNDFFSLLLLVKKLSVVNDLTDGRNSVGRDFYQIKFLFSSQF